MQQHIKTRVTGLLEYLKDNPGLTIEVLAGDTGQSIQTTRRDVRMLEKFGLVSGETKNHSRLLFYRVLERSKIYMNILQVLYGTEGSVGKMLDLIEASGIKYFENFLFSMEPSLKKSDVIKENFELLRNPDLEKGAAVLGAGVPIVSVHSRDVSVGEFIDVTLEKLPNMFNQLKFAFSFIMMWEDAKLDEDPNLKDLPYGRLEALVVIEGVRQLSASLVKILDTVLNSYHWEAELDETTRFAEVFGSEKSIETVFKEAEQFIVVYRKYFAQRSLVSWRSYVPESWERLDRGMTGVNKKVWSQTGQGRSRLEALDRLFESKGLAVSKIANMLAANETAASETIPDIAVVVDEPDEQLPQEIVDTAGVGMLSFAQATNNGESSEDRTVTPLALVSGPEEDSAEDERPVRII